MLTESDEELDELISQAVGRKKAGKGQWHCANCTYANHKDLLECEMCEKPRQLNQGESGKLRADLGLDRNSNSKKSNVKLTTGKLVLCIFSSNDRPKMVFGVGLRPGKRPFSISRNWRQPFL